MKQDATLRQSLRRIDEPSSQAFRQRVHALAAELSCPRQRAILERCDLRGEPHKAVAGALGLSMRQFYRDRAAMFDRLGDLLERERNNRAQVLDAAEMELARARSLRYCGHRKAALNALTVLAREAADPHTALRARAESVAVLTEENEFDACEAHLRESDRFMEARGIHEGAGPALVRAQRREFLWSSGHEAQALAEDRAAFAGVVALAGGGNRAHQECAVRALIGAARHALIAEDFENARKQLDVARRFLHRNDRYAPDLDAWTKLLHAMLLLAAGDRCEPISLILFDAAEVAQRLGWVDLAVAVAIGISMEYQSRQEVQAALDMLRSLIHTGGPRASRLHFGYLCLRVAELEIVSGDAIGALQTLDDVRGCIAPCTYSGASRYLLTARACFALNDIAGAREAASHAALIAAASGNDRMERIARRQVTDCLTSLDAHRVIRSA